MTIYTEKEIETTKALLKANELYMPYAVIESLQNHIKELKEENSKLYTQIVEEINIAHEDYTKLKEKIDKIKDWTKANVYEDV